jgi:GDP-4-dehydro-6-deoxy-D-mannose reductase
MTTVVVTGAAGFVARHLVRALRANGATRLVGIDVRELLPALFDTSIVVDATDQAQVMRALKLERPDLIFHLAGLTKGADEDIYSSNVDSARHLIDCVRRATPRARVVLMGSAAEYGVVPVDQQPVRETYKGLPTGAYGRAKADVAALVWRAATDYGVHAVLARPFNIIGSGISETLLLGAVLDRLRKALAAPAPRAIRIGTVTAVRDFIAVQDVVDGLLRAAERGRSGEAYNFCSGVGRSVGQVLDHLLAFAGEPIRIEHDPQLVREGEVDTLVGSWKKAESELGWAPRTSFEASLRVAWEATSPQAQASMI